MASNFLDTGNKYDQDKESMPGLIAPEFTYGLGVVLAYGARKYAAGNWAKGMDWMRLVNAADRHWLAWKNGEKTDPESGYSHLWHLAFSIMARM